MSADWTGAEELYAIGDRVVIEAPGTRLRGAECTVIGTTPPAFPYPKGTARLRLPDDVEWGCREVVFEPRYLRVVA